MFAIHSLQEESLKGRMSQSGKEKAADKKAVPGRFSSEWNLGRPIPRE